MHTNIHKECLCYQKDDKQTISVRDFKSGDSKTSLLTSHHILLVIDGAVEYIVAGSAGSNIVLRSGEFIFLPVSTTLMWKALEDSTMMRIRLSKMIGKLPECHTFRFQRLSGNLDTDMFTYEGVYPLRMNDRIRHFIEGVMATERDGLRCNTYATHLVGQLLTLIQVYYPQEEYMRFYSTVASPDVVFSDKVYETWMNYKTVGELSGAFNMTTQQFKMHFCRVFGELPGAWLAKRRRERIYHDICSSYKPLKSIAAEHRFSITNFVRYCRTNFGTTPGEIRKELCVSVLSKRTDTPDYARQIPDISIRNPRMLPVDRAERNKLH